jgi:histone-lysine N-methyltransferase SETMAR
MLQEAFGGNALSQSKTFLMVQTLQGRTNVDEDERSGRPSTNATPKNIVKVRDAFLADRRQTIHDVCEISGLSHGTVQRILADNLNMRRISARFLPRLLSFDQKVHRVSVCRELKQQARDDPNFISNIIAGNETWVYSYDSEIKQQSTQWKSPNSSRPKKVRQVRSNAKSRIFFFFFFPLHPRHCPQGIRTPWSNRQWQVLL